MGSCVQKAKVFESLRSYRKFNDVKTSIHFEFFSHSNQKFLYLSVIFKKIRE